MSKPGVPGLGSDEDEDDVGPTFVSETRPTKLAMNAGTSDGQRTGGLHDTQRTTTTTTQRAGREQRERRSERLTDENGESAGGEVNEGNERAEYSELESRIEF